MDNQPPQLPHWTKAENELFENALVDVPDSTPNRWELIAALIPGKTARDVSDHYDALVSDVEAIEAGKIPLPHYKDDDVDNGGNGENYAGGDSKDGGGRGGSKRPKAKRGVDQKKVTHWMEEEHSEQCLKKKKLDNGINSFEDRFLLTMDNRLPQLPQWTKAENELFKNALVDVPDSTPNRWELIAALIPSKTSREVSDHYDSLVRDVEATEAGIIPLPDYKDDDLDNGINGFEDRFLADLLLLFPQWTKAENELFEKALVDVPDGTPNRWELIAALIPGKTSHEVSDHYDVLVGDVEAIEAGMIPLPDYEDDDLDNGINSFEDRFLPDRIPQFPQWTKSENKLFEKALVDVPDGTPNRWELIAALIPGKTACDVSDHYDALVRDVEAIESGKIPLPDYKDDDLDNGGNGENYAGGDSTEGGSSPRSERHS